MTESGIHLWLILWRAFRALSAYAEHDITATLGMCLSDFGILEALLHKGPLSVTEIGNLVQLTSGSMTTAVDRLEVRHLVERRASADDRRTRIIHLTEEGRRVIRKAFQSHQTSMEEAASKLPAKDRQELARLLKVFGYRAAELLEASRKEQPNERTKQ